MIMILGVDELWGVIRDDRFAVRGSVEDLLGLRWSTRKLEAQP